ncbi:unnamed protein product [Sympodiomycopsis kandeliae]
MPIPSETMSEVHTFTYSPYTSPKSPAIHLDVHIPKPIHDASLRTMMYFHAGGLLQSSRKGIAPHMLRSITDKGIALISVDYRLAPQVKVSDIQEDVAKAFNYIVYELGRQLPSGPVLDMDNLVVTGSSAGGWLALMLGLGMLESVGVKEVDRRRIKGLAAIYPITDVGDSWWDQARPPMIKPMWPDEMFEKLADPNAPVESSTEGTPQTNPRTQFYHYAQKEGLFRKYLFTESQLSSDWLTKTSVSKHIANAQDLSSWPNIHLTHGDNDTAVPSQQSSDVYNALKDRGYDRVTYDQIQGKNHMFDAFDEFEDMKTFWEFVHNQWPSS